MERDNPATVAGCLAAFAVTLKLLAESPDAQERQELTTDACEWVELVGERMRAELRAAQTQTAAPQERALRIETSAASGTSPDQPAR